MQMTSKVFFFASTLVLFFYCCRIADQPSWQQGFGWMICLWQVIHIVLTPTVYE